MFGVPTVACGKGRAAAQTDAGRNSASLRSLAAIWLGLNLVFVPGAAHACEDAPCFSSDLITQCQADGGKHQCIGLGAQDCYKDDFATSTIGLCLGAELQFWQTKLEDVSAKLKELDLEWDKNQRQHDFSSRAYETRLETQTAWESYRDLRCAYVTEVWGPGSGSGPAWAECMMRATAEHVLWLQDWLLRY